MYRRAAEMGDPTEGSLEGTFFYEQGGLTKDEAKAAERYRKAVKTSKTSQALTTAMHGLPS